MDVLATPAAIVRFRIAMVPFWIAAVFKPEAKQMYTPEPAIQLTVLPALVADAPAMAEIDKTLPTG